MMKTDLLKGVASITGAGSGIGQSTAVGLVRHGVRKIALIDISRKGMEETAALIQEVEKSVEIEMIEMDVTNEESVASGFKRIVERFGRLDHAVNNAGVVGPLVGSAENTLEGWQKCMSVNMTGVFLCQREELKYMLKQEDIGEGIGRGVIVNTASMLGLVGMPTTMASPAYVASKHAVMGFTKTEGAFYAPHGVRINAVCPGFVGTPMAVETQKSGALDVELARVPMQRIARPDEIANCIAFLAGPMSSYMTGAGLSVDGGYTAY